MLGRCSWRAPSARSRGEDEIESMKLAGARVDQILPNLSPGDAASDACLQFGAMLAAAGADTRIWSSELHPARRDAAHRLDWRALRRRAPDLVLLHHATGSDVPDALRRAGLPYAVYFHNVTPPRYFLGANDLLAGIVWRGLAQLGPLLAAARLAVAPSRFSIAQLEAAGATAPALVPIPFDPAAHAVEPDAELMRRFGDGRTNLLFVGRVAPNKRQDLLLRTFRYYSATVDRDARLLLVGSRAAAPQYAEWLARAARAWDLDAVHLLGHVSDAARAACFRTASVFVSASEHEGFGVPLVEAMHHGVPVVARAAAAVEETVADGGIVVRDADPARLAQLAARVVEDEAMRAACVAAGRARAAAFTSDRVAPALVEAVRRALDAA